MKLRLGNFMLRMYIAAVFEKGCKKWYLFKVNLKKISICVHELDSVGWDGRVSVGGDKADCIVSQ